MPTITRHKIYEAYRKLKNYFYYDDNTSLTIRYKIAEFSHYFIIKKSIPLLCIIQIELRLSWIL